MFCVQIVNSDVPTLHSIAKYFFEVNGAWQSTRSVFWFGERWRLFDTALTLSLTCMVYGLWLVRLLCV